MDNGLNRVYKVYNREISKDLTDIERDKQKFIKQMKEGLGNQINDIGTYIKPEPSFFDKLKAKFKRAMKAL